MNFLRYFFVSICFFSLLKKLESSTFDGIYNAKIKLFMNATNNWRAPECKFSMPVEIIIHLNNGIINGFIINHGRQLNTDRCNGINNGKITGKINDQGKILKFDITQNTFYGKKVGAYKVTGKINEVSILKSSNFEHNELLDDVEFEWTKILNTDKNPDLKKIENKARLDYLKNPGVLALEGNEKNRAEILISKKEKDKSEKLSKKEEEKKRVSDLAARKKAKEEAEKEKAAKIAAKKKAKEEAKKLARQEAERKKDLKISKNKTENQIDNSINTDTIELSSITEGRKGTINGRVLKNFELAELIINDEEIKLDKSGNFTYSTFIPKRGILIKIEIYDTKGNKSEKIISLNRSRDKDSAKLNFAKLNPLKINGKNKQHAVGLIIGVEKYLYAPEAKYADRDASYFTDFLINTMGVKEENIKTLSNKNASQTEIKIALKRWLKALSTPEKSNIFLFFAGHGLASADGKDLYLLPYDGEPRLLEDTALLRSEIFQILKEINPRTVTVFFDSCYSGQTREKNMIIADARPITITPIEKTIPENFTIFSASSGSEMSGSLPEASHGLFSYFLMKGLEGNADTNKDDKITSNELYTYIRSNVTREAFRLGREQTPQLQGDKNMVLVEFN